MKNTEDLYEESGVNAPSIRISLKWNKLHIHKTTIKALHSPRYVQLLIEKNKNILVVRGCNRKERDCFPVPESLFKKARTSFYLESKLLMEVLRIQIGWEQGVAYRVIGKLLPQSGAISFDLNQGELLNDLNRSKKIRRRHIMTDITPYIPIG
jgi:hypothetical protein